MTPSTFEIKIIQKQATPLPATTAIGTGSYATRADFLIVLPSQVGSVQAPTTVILPQPTVAGHRG